MKGSPRDSEHDAPLLSAEDHTNDTVIDLPTGTSRSPLESARLESRGHRRQRTSSECFRSPARLRNAAGKPSSQLQHDKGTGSGQPGSRYKVPEGYQQEDDEYPQLLVDMVSWSKKRTRKIRKSVSQLTRGELLQKLLPCSEWLATYKVREYLLGDLVAGISVGAMVIPQGLSYADLAGLPTIYGLYGAFIPAIIYAFFGSSRQLAVGPVAVTSLLLSSGLASTVGVAPQAIPNMPDDPAAQEAYNTAAIQVSFLVSLIYMLIGTFRLGFVTNFLSHPVISGFTTGAAFIIGLSQVKLFLGVSVARDDRVHLQLENLVRAGGGFRYQEFVMGMSWLLLLVVFKQLGSRYKRLSMLKVLGPLTVSVLSISIVSIFKLGGTIAVVGDIPKGLPPLSVGRWFPMQNFGGLINLSVIITLVGILESISIAKALAAKHRYELNPTQEFQALGISNLVGSCFSAYPTTGSFSRSAVSNDTGAKTQLSCFVSGLLVMLVLLFITPVFTNMPQNAQGAIIISGVLGLVNYGEAAFLWKVNKFDWLVFMVAMLGTMFLGVEEGLGVAVAISVLLVMYKSAFPHTAVLGRLPGTTVYRNVKQYAEAEQAEGILVVRIDAPIYFANIVPIRDALKKYEKKAERRAETSGVPTSYLILDLSPVTDIDASAVHFLKEMVHEYRGRGVQLALANPAEQVMRMMRRSGIVDAVGEEFMFVHSNDAVLYCRDLLDADCRYAPPAKALQTAAGYELLDSGHQSGGWEGWSEGSSQKSGAQERASYLLEEGMENGILGAGRGAQPHARGAGESSNSPTVMERIERSPLDPERD